MSGHADARCQNEGRHLGERGVVERRTWTAGPASPGGRDPIVMSSVGRRASAPPRQERAATTSGRGTAGSQATLTRAGAVEPRTTSSGS
jgi:hypothetical protein